MENSSLENDMGKAKVLFDTLMTKVGVLEVVTMKIVELEAKVQRLKEESTKFVEGGMVAYAQGFEKAKRHVAFFIPNIDLSKFDVEKDVFNRALVGEDTIEELAKEITKGGVATTNEIEPVVMEVDP